MSSPVSDFLESCIKALKPDNFRELIIIFQKEYWDATEVISIDGTNDGGNDLKIFKGKAPLKKNVQLTTQKLIGTKIQEDLKKAYDNMIKYGFSENFEFYWSQPISEDKRQEYESLARKNYGINLNLFDARMLSQVKSDGIKEYIYRLHKQPTNTDLLKVDKSTKVLYDLLAVGNDTTEIKNNFLHSFIVFFVYEKVEAEFKDILDYLREKLNGEIDEGFLRNEINILKSKKRLLSKMENKSIFQLAKEEENQISDFVKQAEILENTFNEQFTLILQKYNLESETERIIDYLTKLYKTNYQLDIDETANKAEFEDAVDKIL